MLSKSIIPIDYDDNDDNDVDEFFCKVMMLLEPVSQLQAALQAELEAGGEVAMEAWDPGRVLLGAD